MTSAAARTPAGQLVEAFGDVEAMQAMYDGKVVWRLNASLSPRIAGPHVGKNAVVAFNRLVFERLYQPGCSVEIFDEVGDETSSVARFAFRANTTKGHRYAVEYALFAKTRGGKITDVIELLDTQASTDQHQGGATGLV